MNLIANRWMFVPVLLLGLTVTIATVTVMSAVVGHPLGAEPNYDAKAASWNAEREQRAANERLRWVVTPEIESEGVRRSVSLRIEDDGDDLVLKRYYHLGIAVDTERGLVVPVVRDVDRKGLLELADRKSTRLNSSHRT